MSSRAQGPEEQGQGGLGGGGAGGGPGSERPFFAELSPHAPGCCPPISSLLSPSTLHPQGHPLP